MMDRRGLEVLFIQETKWKIDRARAIMGRYKLLHAEEDGRSNGEGIIVSEEEFREALERMMRLVELEVMLCIV